MLKSYIAARSGFILGVHYAEGAKVPVTEVQAKYLAPPFGDALNVETARAQAKPQAAAKSEKPAI